METRNTARFSGSWGTRRKNKINQHFVKVESRGKDKTLAGIVMPKEHD